MMQRTPTSTANCCARATWRSVAPSPSWGSSCAWSAGRTRTTSSTCSPSLGMDSSVKFIGLESGFWPVVNQIGRISVKIGKNLTKIRQNLTKIRPYVTQIRIRIRQTWLINPLQVRPGLGAEAALHAAAEGPARQETRVHEDRGLESGQGRLPAGKSFLPSSWRDCSCLVQS